MPDIKLPDGKKIPFSKTINGFEIAEKISKSLAKDACAISIDGELKDLSYPISKEAQVKIITIKDEEGLEIIRHDAAHILAMSVQELFPKTQVTIGPVIQDGFYYDFSRKESFTKEDLKKIEKKMVEIVDRNKLTKREVWKRNEAIDHFNQIGEKSLAHFLEAVLRDQVPWIPKGTKLDRNLVPLKWVQGSEAHYKPLIDEIDDDQNMKSRAEYLHQLVNEPDRQQYIKTFHPDDSVLKNAKELSDDFTGMSEVIADAVSWMCNKGWQLDTVCSIYATSIFFTVKDLKKGLHALISGKWAYAFSVTDFEYPIFRALKENSHGGINMYYPKYFESRSNRQCLVDCQGGLCRRGCFCDLDLLI